MISPSNYSGETELVHGSRDARSPGVRFPAKFRGKFTLSNASRDVRSRDVNSPGKISGKTELVFRPLDAYLFAEFSVKTKL